LLWAVFNYVAVLATLCRSPLMSETLVNLGLVYIET
jgi:hypothetical protein